MSMYGINRAPANPCIMTLMANRLSPYLSSYTTHLLLMTNDQKLANMIFLNYIEKHNQVVN